MFHKITRNSLRLPTNISMQSKTVNPPIPRTKFTGGTSFYPSTNAAYSNILQSSVTGSCKTTVKEM